MTDFKDLIDLASERLGGAVLAANDEFFAPKENLLKASKPVFNEGKYTDRGKWMDGWETRRSRNPSFDWCIIRLGLPGVVRGVDVDTSYFKGNYPESCSLEGCELDGFPGVEQVLAPEIAWTELLYRSVLNGDASNAFAIETERRFTHLRLKIYPDGGVARLRVYGEVIPDSRRMGGPGQAVDLAAVENGGLVVACSDMFFGSRNNLIMPGPPRDISDGWETRRRRGPGFDWAIIRLGLAGTIQQVAVDTTHFKGNYPESCSLEACQAQGATVEHLTSPAVPWMESLPRTKLQAHTRQLFDAELKQVGAVTHVRLNVFPDGGVARLRVVGLPAGRRE